MRAHYVLACGALFFTFVAWAAAPLVAQRSGIFRGAAEDPAIEYSGPAHNAVTALNEALDQGREHLMYQGRSGYLQSALAALKIPVDSQMLVFSQTSLQGRRIGPANPRALFFADGIALGWVRDGDVVEVAVQDSLRGIVFYTLDQKPDEAPRFKRMTTCLACHYNANTLGVPGLLMFSTTPADEHSSGKQIVMDQQLPLKDRWAGWFVTGSTGSVSHLGNEVPGVAAHRELELSSVAGLFDPDGYRTMFSDVGALLVFSHQIYMTNLLTRVGWEARAADPRVHQPFVAAPGQDAALAEMMRGVAREVVDYLLFIDEAPLGPGLHGSSGFADRFSAIGPRDKKGRSLHELDLNRRLMKYPCSYLIQSSMFDELPEMAKEPIYHRLWEVLSGTERDARYLAALSRVDRQAIVEILRDTKNDLPGYFRQAID
jgi:hypothetical protein